MYFFYAGGLLVPIFVGVLSIIWPCFPSLFSSLLCHLDGNNSQLWRWTQAGLAIFEFILYRTLCLSGIHYAISTAGTSMAALWLDCKKLLLLNSTIFIRNNDYRYRDDEFTRYSNLKVFEKIVNSCVKDRIFLTLALVGPLLQVLVGFSIIKIGHFPNPVIIIGLLIIYVAILTMTMSYFSVAAHLNRISIGWMNRQKEICVRKEDRKRLRATTSIRVEFGNNFVEALTPLVVQEFCIHNTVSLLLLTN